MSVLALLLATIASLPDGYHPVVDYDLAVRLDPAAKKLTASGKVTFENTTSLPVSELWWHLYLNAFRNDRSTLIKESSGGKLRKDVFERGKWGYVEVTKLATGGDDLLAKRTFEHPDDDNADDRTVMRTPLANEIPPGGSVTVELAFEARLPKVFARSGWGGDFFMVGQWFPKLGVLEVVKDGGAEKLRWNCHQYHATSEFFADYGHFKVAITVPKGHEVGATGKLINTEEHPDGTVTFTHEQDRVHDFAFAADPRFLRRERQFSPERDVKPEETHEVAELLGVGDAELVLSPVKVTLLLQPEHEMFEDRYFKAALNALEWFGLWYGAYPYETLTIIDGPRVASGAMGMEYPTLITGGVRWPSSSEMAMPEGVTIHEFGHQYWYGMVGSNEFEESWLDEGFNTYSTGKVLDRAYGTFVYAPPLFDVPLALWFSNLRLDQTTAHKLGTLLSPTSDEIVRPAWLYRNALSYGVNSYPRTGLTLRQLERELGAQTMARAMRLYHLRWRYRHPKTSDFVAAVEEAAQKPMGWFFDRTVHSPGAVDYAVTELKSERIHEPAGIFDDQKEVSVDEVKAIEKKQEAAGEKPSYATTVYLERVGEVTWPVSVEVRFEDGTTKTDRWDGAYRWARFNYTTPSKAESAALYADQPNQELLLDLDPSNDSRTLSKNVRPGVAHGATILYLVETALELLGAIL